MYRFAAAAFVVVLVLLAGMASAQDQITLNGTASGAITFTGAGSGSGGSNLTMSLGSCTLGSHCITGTATGTGSLSSTGSYELSGGPLSLTSVSPGSWNVSGILNFAYFNGGTNLLSGTLNLLNFTQVGSLGLFNDTLTANLTGLSGSLASSIGSSAITDITIVIRNGVNLSGLGNGANASASISSGEIFLPTPEPGSMVLFGSGLVAVGSMLRRRVKAKA